MGREQAYDLTEFEEPVRVGSYRDSDMLLEVNGLKHIQFAKSQWLTAKSFFMYLYIKYKLHQI